MKTTKTFWMTQTENELINIMLTGQDLSKISEETGVSVSLLEKIKYRRTSITDKNVLLAMIKKATEKAIKSELHFSKVQVNLKDMKQKYINN